MNAYGVDLYSVNISPGPNFGKYTDLTNSPYSWEEHAVYSPNGQKILYISSLPFADIIPQYGNLPWADYRDYLHNEYFIMNANGTGVQQVTWFNTPNSPYSAPQFGDTMYAEWNLAGTQVLIHNGAPEIQVPGGNSIWLITFGGTCGG
jgi:Tol biopolymer transport system component